MALCPVSIISSFKLSCFMCLHSSGWMCTYVSSYAQWVCGWMCMYILCTFCVSSHAQWVCGWMCTYVPCVPSQWVCVGWMCTYVPCVPSQWVCGWMCAYVLHSTAVGMWLDEGTQDTHLTTYPL